MYWLHVYAILLFLSWPVLLFASEHHLVPEKPLSPGRVLISQDGRQKEVPRCTAHGDGFLTIPGIKVSDKFLHVRSRSFDECKEECRSNCSCVAYAYSSMSNMDIDGDATRCLVWMGDLITMEKCTQGGENLYVRANRLRGT
jgi:hypothetical protein